MRHRLAVRTLVRWYREGRNVEHEIPKLSTYLGHVHVADTYWYIEAVPELLRLATERATGRRETATCPISRSRSSGCRLLAELRHALAGVARAELLVRRQAHRHDRSVGRSAGQATCRSRPLLTS